MATKVLAAILFMLKLFPHFWSNDILHIYFSWNKVVCADTQDPQMVRDQKKFGNHWLNANKKLLASPETMITTIHAWDWAVTDVMVS